MGFVAEVADGVVTQLGLQLRRAGLEERFVRQALLGGRKKRDNLAVTLTFLHKTGEVLSVVAWQATGQDIKVELAINGYQNKKCRARDILAGLEAQLHRAGGVVLPCSCLGMLELLLFGGCVDCPSAEQPGCAA